MSYFEGQTPAWAHRRQQSWDPQHQQTHPARTGASPISPREDISAFTSQFEEVARASDNLAKSGKMQPTHGRRESMPVPGSFARQYPEIESRLGAMGQRAHPVSDFDGGRSHSAHSSSSLQGYLANQRFGPRANDGDQMMQAKRRAAAQRERELRNYHQEQQYNRTNSSSVSGAKSDRSMSPGGMSEEDRRELIARQHRALYGNESNLYTGDGSAPRPISQDARVLAAASSGHGSSPLGFDPYAQGQSSNAENVGTMPTTAGNQQQLRGGSSSPPGDSSAFGLYEGSQQQQQQQLNRTSSSSPGTSPTRRGTKTATSGGVAPIGTRPIQGPGQAKRNTPPMPSPLSYGLPGEKGTASSAERSTSAASNPSNNQTGGTDKPVNLGWNSGGWSNSKSSLGVQAPVWG